MATNISVKTKIRVNGREYASVEEMPADVRQTYERALAMSAGGAHRGLLGSIGSAVHTKIVFNGQEYTSAEHMPAAVRRLYDDVIATLQSEKQNSAGPGAEPVSAGSPLVDSTLALASSAVSGVARPESTTMRLVIAGVVAAALLLAAFVLRH